MALDGVMQAPGFEEHPDGKQGWVMRRQSEETQRFIGEVFEKVDTFLLGKTTYLIWAAFWPTASGDASALAQVMNSNKKYVVSSTLLDPLWENTEVLGTDWPERVAQIKREDGGAILVSGSADLVNGLMQHGLVDEYQIFLFPVVVGSGKHLFREGMDVYPLHLVRAQAFDTGVVALVYEPGDEPAGMPTIEEYVWTDEQVRSLHAAEDVNRVLATVLFTDIIGSSERAAALGDKRWRVLLERHDELVAAEVARWHGQIVKSTGDGILATFDTPTRALRCAFGLAVGLGALGLRIRAGIHTGEVEVQKDGDVRGIAVHIASRAMAEAGDGRVVVTRTVRDLASGADLGFEPMGSVALRGIPGEWELFDARLVRPQAPPMGYQAPTQSSSRQEE
jgi:class 3 adenylate cyclase/dihydrofolate reductase